jgi:hypothetical protein
MKPRTLIAGIILILALIAFLGSCATRKKAISEEDFFETWSGTWINTDYGGDKVKKIITRPDGTREFFGLLTSTMVMGKDKITILDQWVDSKGTIWYRGHWEFILPTDTKGYEMGKISDSGNTLERIFASEDYPIEEWEPDRFEYNYRIYYRQ